MPVSKSKKAMPQMGGSSVKFTVVLPHSVFEMLDREATGGLNWRQLSQKVLADYAESVRQRETATAA